VNQENFPKKIEQIGSHHQFVKEARSKGMMMTRHRITSQKWKKKTIGNFDDKKSFQKFQNR